MHTLSKTKSKSAELESKFKTTNLRFMTTKFLNLTNMESNVSVMITKLDQCLSFGETELNSVLMMESSFMGYTVNQILEVMLLLITEKVELR